MPKYAINPETNEGEVLIDNSDAWKRGSQIPKSEHSSDNIYLAWRGTIRDTNFTFYVTNKSGKLIWFNWKLKKGSTEVKQGNDIWVQNKESSKDIKVEDLTENTTYTLTIMPYYNQVDNIAGQIITSIIALDVINYTLTTKSSSSTVVAPKITVEEKNSNFNFLFQYIPSKGMMYSFSEYKVNATKIGPQNRFYNSKWSNWPDSINPYPYLMSNGQPSDPNMTDNPWFYKGSVLPNCVSYAFGRLCEVWYLCLEEKYIILDDLTGDYYLCNRYTGDKIRKIKGTFSSDILEGILNNASAQWWSSKWAAYNKEGWGVSETPMAGAIICWDGSFPGHVAFIEEVRNAGTDDEEIIISQTWYGSTIERTPTIQQLRKKDYTYYGGSYKFLVSPVCQLISPLNSDLQNEILLELINYDITEHDQTLYNELGHLYEIKLNEPLEINDKVEIQWFGNTKADGTGRSVGNLTLIGQITNINRSAEYTYEVTVADKIVGYYPRESLVKTTSSLSTSTRPLTDNLRTSSPVLFSARINTDKLRVRAGHNTTSDILVDEIPNGTNINVYQVVSSGGYNWYKIDKNYDKWVANTQDKNDKDYPWIITISPSSIDVGDYKYKAQFTTEVKVRSTPELRDDNILPKPYKKAGEIVNVYSAFPDDPSKENLTVYPETGYDADNYCWRRIGEDQWVPDVLRAGGWLIDINNTPAAKAKAIGELTIVSGVELNIRTSPGKGNNKTGRKIIGDGFPRNYYKVVKNVDGYDWYRLSNEDDEWVANGYDPEINSYYIINITGL